MDENSTAIPADAFPIPDGVCKNNIFKSVSDTRWFFRLKHRNSVCAGLPVLESRVFPETKVSNCRSTGASDKRIEHGRFGFAHDTQRCGDDKKKNTKSLYATDPTTECA